MTIFLVRHGETEWNRIGRYQGWGDSPLTERGVAQAEAIGRRLREIPEASAAEIVASPLGRARRTAEIIAERLTYMAPLRFDERLREISLGSWEGLDHAQIRALAPDLLAGDARHEWYFRTPDGETYETFSGRLAEWLDEPRERPVIAVCHGVVTRILRGLYTGQPRAAAMRLPVPQDRIFRLAEGRIEEVLA